MTPIQTLSQRFERLALLFHVSVFSPLPKDFRQRLSFDVNATDQRLFERTHGVLLRRHARVRRLSAQTLLGGWFQIQCQRHLVSFDEPVPSPVLRSGK